jgi:hypothetical protein
MFSDIDIELKLITCIPSIRVMLDYWLYCLSTHRNKSYTIYPMLVFQSNLPFVKNMPGGKEIFKIMSQGLEFFMYHYDKIMIMVVVMVLMVVMVKMGY